jgi:AraC-like DNA-binding protein
LPEITFQRTGMFIKHCGRRRAACDPNTLLFINQGEAYSLSHPVPLPCACTALHVAPEVLAEIVSRGGGCSTQRPTELFAFDSHPSRAEFSVDHYRLLGLARSAGGADPVAVEEAGLHLAAQVVSTACQQRGHRPSRLKPRTARAHAETAQAVREFLAGNFQQRLTLTHIANRVHAAPNHLCRLFKRQTGFSIHQYLTRLRLAAALERLAEPDISLTDLALDLGFATPSHFSTALLREFGVQPSRLRRRLRSTNASGDAGTPRQNSSCVSRPDASRPGSPGH